MKAVNFLSFIVKVVFKRVHCKFENTPPLTETSMIYYNILKHQKFGYDKEEASEKRQNVLAPQFRLLRALKTSPI